MIPAAYTSNSEGKEAPWLWRVWKYGLLLPLFYYTFTVFRVFGLRSACGFVFFIVLLFTLNFSWDVLFITATRWMLRIASNTRQLAGVLMAIVLDAVLGITILVGPLMVALYIVSKSNGSLIGVGLFLGFALKLIDFAIASLVLILLTLIGIHLIVWFVLERPIYSIVRFKVIRDKKLLRSVILALIALPEIGSTWASFIALLKAI
jgi:hypothetical protein